MPWVDRTEETAAKVATVYETYESHPLKTELSEEDYLGRMHGWFQAEGVAGLQELIALDSSKFAEMLLFLMQDVIAQRESEDREFDLRETIEDLIHYDVAVAEVLMVQKPAQLKNVFLGSPVWLFSRMVPFIKALRAWFAFQIPLNESNWEVCRTRHWMGNSMDFVHDCVACLPGWSMYLRKEARLLGKRLKIDDVPYLLKDRRGAHDYREDVEKEKQEKEEWEREEMQRQIQAQKEAAALATLERTKSVNLARELEEGTMEEVSDMQHQPEIVAAPIGSSQTKEEIKSDSTIQPKQPLKIETTMDDDAYDDDPKAPPKTRMTRTESEMDEEKSGIPQKRRVQFDSTPVVSKPDPDLQEALAESPSATMESPSMRGYRGHGHTDTMMSMMSNITVGSLGGAPITPYRGPAATPSRGPTDSMSEYQMIKGLSEKNIHEPSYSINSYDLRKTDTESTLTGLGGPETPTEHSLIKMDSMVSLGGMDTPTAGGSGTPGSSRSFGYGTPGGMSLGAVDSNRTDTIFATMGHQPTPAARRGDGTMDFESSEGHGSKESMTMVIKDEDRDSIIGGSGSDGPSTPVPKEDESGAAKAKFSDERALREMFDEGKTRGIIAPLVDRAMRQRKTAERDELEKLLLRLDELLTPQ